MERPAKEQIDRAVEDAGLAFWATIAAAFPELNEPEAQASPGAGDTPGGHEGA